jgi:hypothetical protein
VVETIWRMSGTIILVSFFFDAHSIQDTPPNHFPTNLKLWVMTRLKVTSMKSHGCLKRVVVIQLLVVDQVETLLGHNQGRRMLAWVVPVRFSLDLQIWRHSQSSSCDLMPVVFDYLSVRPPFSNSTAGPNMPPLPPAMLALMNGQNGMSSPGSGPPPMRFAGPPIPNNMPPGMMQPPHVNGYSSGPLPPQPQPASGGQGAPPLTARMNPDRARQLGLI